MPASSLLDSGDEHGRIICPVVFIAHSVKAIAAHASPTLVIPVEIYHRCRSGRGVAERHDDADVMAFEDLDDERQGSGHDGKALRHVLEDLRRIRVPIVSFVVQQGQARGRAPHSLDHLVMGQSAVPSQVTIDVSATKLLAHLR
jgi:hypothetical protein